MFFNIIINTYGDYISRYRGPFHNQYYDQCCFSISILIKENKFNDLYIRCIYNVYNYPRISIKD